MSAGVAQAADPPPPPPPVGLYEILLSPGLDYNFDPAIAADPEATPPVEAAPATLSAAGFNAGSSSEDGVGYYISAYNIVSDGPTTLTPGETEEDPVAGSVAVVERDTTYSANGLNFSKYAGTTTCTDVSDTDTCDTDITALTASSTLAAEGLVVSAGGKTVSLTAAGLNNGGNKITGVADGTAPTDAVNVRQLTAVQASLAAETNDRIAADNLLRNQIASSTATAIALGGSVILPDTKFSLSGNVGFYKGAQAVAMTAAARLAPNVYLTGAVGGGLNKNGSAGGRVGFAIGW
ncbi:MAG: YadA-like family protein [Chakrabartia sp.]